MAAAGLPGTGIGGLFYVVAALVAPFRYAWRRATGRAVRGTPRDVVILAAIALGVVGGIWLAGWFLGFALAMPSVATRLAGGLPGIPTQVASVLRVAAIVAGLATLGLVLGSVELLRLASRRTRQRAGAGTLSDG